MVPQRPFQLAAWIRCRRWQDWAQVNEYLIDSGLVGDEDVAFLYNLTWTIYNFSRTQVCGILK